MQPSVKHIWRHPVKSLGREALESTTLASGKPLPGDRRWAIAHERSKFDGQWVPCQNFSRGSQSPGLMAVEAAWDQSNGTITFRHPELDELVANPDTQGEAIIGWMRGLVPENRPAPQEIVTLPERGLTDTDFPSVSIGSLSSLSDLGGRMGDAMDMRRFRINFWLEGLSPWEELGWVGKRLRLRGAEIEIRDQITRCKATESNPSSGRIDAAVLSALNALGHQEFGIYGQVVLGGDVRLGDKAELLS